MAKSYSGRTSRGGSTGGRGYRTSSSSSSRGNWVSAARLSQKSGPSNTFGSYAKVKHSNGTFSMREVDATQRRFSALDDRICSGVTVDDLTSARKGLHGFVRMPKVAANLPFEPESAHQCRFVRSPGLGSCRKP